MYKLVSLFYFVLTAQFLFAQFPPPAGQTGSTAIYKDSSVFVGWAIHCTLNLGYQNIANTSSGLAAVGDNTSALGIAGTGGVVSLGDGGEAIVQFARPIFNGPGWDFAVFENSFSDSFLELAFVEVSSDGLNYFRFPAVSNSQNLTQIGAFDTLDATKINNLAGKYRALYGTPFDLEEMDNIVGLDINNITHIKIIDVVGSIQSAYARYDSNNNIINDPWPTEFASSGFDLDAVGVIHQLPLDVSSNDFEFKFQIYPNPVFKHQKLNLNFYSINSDKIILEFVNATGIIMFSKQADLNVAAWNNLSIDFPNDLKAGIYFLKVYHNNEIRVQKIIITD